MCGIVGFTGTAQAAPILLDGLSKLEYRGYDSAGLAVRNGTDETVVVKAVGKLVNLGRGKAVYNSFQPRPFICPAPVAHIIKPRCKVSFFLFRLGVQINFRRCRGSVPHIFLYRVKIPGQFMEQRPRRVPQAVRR